MQKGTDLILVSGATGRQGGATARALLAAGHRVRVMTRRPDGEAAAALADAGAEVVYADFDDEPSLRRALDGVWGVFAVQDTWTAGVELEEEQGKRFANLAREAGVEHYVYTSVASSDRDTGIPHFENKYRVEQVVRDLGFPSFTILRPVFFMENFTAPSSLPALLEGTLALGIEPTTSLQMVAARDIGEYGRAAFERHEAWNGRAIEIAGDEMTMPEAAEVIGGAMGRPVSFEQVPIEQIRSWSEDFALMLEWFEAVGYDVDIEATAEETGIAPTRLDEWAGSIEWAGVAV